jgi:hypothetical protein
MAATAIIKPSEALRTASTTKTQTDGRWVIAKSGVAIVDAGEPFDVPAGESID